MKIEYVKEGKICSVDVGEEFTLVLKKGVAFFNIQEIKEKGILIEGTTDYVPLSGFISDDGISDDQSKVMSIEILDRNSILIK